MEMRVAAAKEKRSAPREAHVLRRANCQIGVRSSGPKARKFWRVWENFEDSCIELPVNCEVSQEAVIMATRTMPAPRGLDPDSGSAGESEREKDEKEERVNLHQENAHKIRKGRETRIMQEEELDGNEGDGDENEDEKEFGEQEFRPLVGLGDPPLAIADEGIGLNDTDDKEGPEGH